MSHYSIVDTTLPNGLKVFVVTDPSTTLTAVKTVVRAGSITEGACLGQGLSHFLEHLVAGGPTTFRTESDYKTGLSLLGGGYNAYTTNDHTCYYINTTPEHTHEAIKILSEWMFFNTFGTIEFEREREVITREIEKNNAEIGRVYYQLCQSHFYQNHELKYPVIGHLENFRRTTIQQLKDYYRRYYTASNMILVVGSPLSAEEILPWVELEFGRATTEAAPVFPVVAEPTPFAARRLEKSWDTATTYYSIRFATTDLFSDDLYALDLLDFILTNGEDSLIVKDIVDDKKWAYSASSSSYTPSVSSGYFDFSFDLDKDRCDDVKHAVFGHLATIARGNIDEAMVLRAKKQKLAEDIFSITTIDDRISRIGMGYLYGQSPDFYDVYTAKFRQVTVQDVITVAKKYFDPSRVVETVMIPKQEAVVATGPTIIVPATSGIQKHSYPNGVRLLINPERSIPRLHVKTFFEGGLRRESSANNGIGTMMADMLGTATSTRTKLEIAKMIEDNGADISSSIGNNTLSYSLDCLSEDLDVLAPLYLDTMTDAQFVKSELVESRRQILKWIGQRRDDWYRYASYQFRKQFYGDHPCGMPSNGEIESVKAITTSDLAAYYDSHWNPNRMVISVAGDIDPQKAIELFAPIGHFEKSGIPVGHLTRTLHTTPNWIKGAVDQDIASVFVAFDGGRLTDHDDAIRLDLMTTVLSGMNYPGGRLHHLLRDEGLVYMVHGANHLGVEPGYIVFYALTSDPHQQRVHDIIHEQITSVKTDKISSDEFGQAIAQMKFHYKDRIAPIEAMGTIAAVDELLGKGFEHSMRIAEAVDRLRIEDVQDLANTYLNNPQVYWFNK